MLEVGRCVPLADRSTRITEVHRYATSPVLDAHRKAFYGLGCSVPCVLFWAAAFAWSTAARQVCTSVALTGTSMDFPSRVGLPPCTTGSKQSAQTPLSVFHCPTTNPNFLHSSTIRWQAGVFSAAFCTALWDAAWWVLPGVAGCAAAACAIAFIPNVTDARNVPETKIRLIVLVFIVPSPVGSSSLMTHTISFTRWCQNPRQPLVHCDKRTRSMNAARLTVRSSPIVKITLRQPVLVCYSCRRPQAFDTLLVSADEPERFCRALKQAAVETCRI